MAKRTNSSSKTSRSAYPLAYKKIDQAINAQKERLVATSLALINEKTVNFDKASYPETGPDNMLIPGMEYKLIEYIRPILEEAHIPYQTYDESLKRPSLIASIGKGQPQQKEVLLIVHLDTLPSDRFTWKKINDPFKGEEIGGKVYGNGISRSKGSAAALIESLLCLKEMEEKIPGTIHVAFISDELVNNGSNFANIIAASDFDPDEIILAYQGNGPKCIGIAAPGTITCTIRTNATLNQENTSHVLHDIIHELFTTRFKPIQRSKLFNQEPTFNLENISGMTNKKTNTASATFTLDLLSNQTQDTILDQIRAIVTELSPKDIDWEILPEHYIPPFHIKQQPVSLKVLKRFTELTPVANNDTSLANHLVAQGKTPLCYGFQSQSPNDESIKVSELITYTKTVAKTCFTLAQEEKE